MEKRKDQYEGADIKILLFDSTDIITSSPLGNDGNSDGDGWTTPSNDGNW